jgi:hypothetical protein
MNEIIQIKADEDGCIYMYNLATGTWQKVCDVIAPNELPASVARKVAEMQRSMVG